MTTKMNRYWVRLGLAFRQNWFECIVLSTSKHATESLARAGAFREVGISDVPSRAARTMLAAA
jgi:hypothetical protein